MKICSSNESSHQIFKVDLGQDLTMSCLFDQDKIEQVINISLINIIWIFIGLDYFLMINCISLSNWLII